MEQKKEFASFQWRVRRRLAVDGHVRRRGGRPSAPRKEGGGERVRSLGPCSLHGLPGGSL